MHRIREFASVPMLVAASALLGCSAIVSPDPSRLGSAIDAGGGLDAGGGMIDASRVDAGAVDAGTTPTDAGAPIDAGRPGEDGGPPPRDAGPFVCPGPPACDGDTRLFCEGSTPRFERCDDDDAFCEDGGCLPWRCDPLTTRCDNTGIVPQSVMCDARGAAQIFAPCPSGCDDRTGLCVDATECAAVPSIALGDTVEIDLCARPDANTYRAGGPGSDCGGSIADVGDQIYELVITEAGGVNIELTDIDEGRSIDTVLYVRRACSSVDSQLACDDDVLCPTSTVPDGARCTGAVDVRQSRLLLTLEPGTYYIVADAHDYMSGETRYRCGRVQLDVRARP